MTAQLPVLIKSVDQQNGLTLGDNYVNITNKLNTNKSNLKSFETILQLLQLISQCSVIVFCLEFLQRIKSYPTLLCSSETLLYQIGRFEMILLFLLMYWKSVRGNFVFSLSMHAYHYVIPCI
jgi:hypothetical protein